MFKNNKTGNMATNQSFDTNAIDRIAEGTTIEGNINSSLSIRIDGRVKGSVICSGRLVVGPTGVIDGEVECETADVEGTLNATLLVKDLLELKATAVLNGDTKPGKLSIQPGAQLNGKVDMGGTIKNIQQNKSEDLAEKTA